MQTNTSSEIIRGLRYLGGKMIFVLGSSGFIALLAAFGLSFKGYPVVQTYFTALGGLGLILVAIGGFGSFGTTDVRPTRTIMPGAVSAAELQAIKDKPSAKDRVRLNLAQSVSLLLSGIILMAISFFFVY